MIGMKRVKKIQMQTKQSRKVLRIIQIKISSAIHRIVTRMKKKIALIVMRRLRMN